MSSVNEQLACESLQVVMLYSSRYHRSMQVLNMYKKISRRKDRRCRSSYPSTTFMPPHPSVKYPYEVPSQATKSLPLAPVWVMEPARVQSSSVMTTRSGPGDPRSVRKLFTLSCAISRLTTSEDIAIGHDGELLERTVKTLEVKALVVVVCVRVVVRPNGSSVLDVLASSLHSSRDICGSVVHCTASGRLVTDNDVGSGAHGSDAKEDGGDGELHVDGWGG